MRAAEDGGRWRPEPGLDTRGSDRGSDSCSRCSAYCEQLAGMRQQKFAAASGPSLRVQQVPAAAST